MNYKRGLIAGLAVLALAGAGWFAWSALQPPPPPPKSKPLFADWAAIVVAGDWRAHSGAPSKVFDNARHALVQKFLGLGFEAANIRQFSAVPADYPYDAVQEAAEGPITTGLAAVTARAKGGCLLYFTSHGAPDGIVIGNRIVDPAPLAAKVSEYCGDRPTVTIISACYAGIFVPLLEGPHRIVFTAARADRTSFGCGEKNQYTFFDTCVLQEIGNVASFPALAEMVKGCVSDEEEAMNADGARKGLAASLPSEPQFVMDPQMGYLPDWR